MTPDLAIIGPGVLGLSLARRAAERGLRVTLAGRDLDHAQRALGALEGRWDRAVARGALSPGERREASARLRPCPSWAAAADGAPVVLEALPEDLDRKAQAWSLLDAALPGATLRLTGSSSLPLAAIRAAADLAGPLLGFHLFVPVRRMDIVELVVQADTPPALEGAARALAERLGLGVARVLDQPGYAASRMALAQALEAMRLLEAGACGAADLDALMVRGYGHPCGPLELSDRIGLDLRLAIAQGLFQATGAPGFEPPALLKAMVARGATGRKAGQGFYAWNHEGART